MLQHVNSCDLPAAYHYLQLEGAAKGINLGVIGAVGIGARLFLREEGAVKLLERPLHATYQGTGGNGGSSNALDVFPKSKLAALV